MQTVWRERCVAGSEIVRFISSAINSILHSVFVFPLYDPTGFTSVEAAEAAIRRAAAYTDATLLLSVLLQFAILFCYLYLIAKQFTLPYRRLPLHEKLLFILPSFTALCVSVTLHMVVISMESGMSVIVYDTAPATRFWVPLICLLLLGVVISSAVSFQKMLRHNEDEINRLLLQKQLSEMQNEVREIQDVYGDIRGLQHDMRDHLMNIHALIEKGDAGKDDLCVYMDRMEQTLHRLDFPVKTGSLITDIIISRKRREAEEKGIPLTMDFLFPANLQIDAYDIGVVLNNALSNAMEAAEQSGGGISLRAYTKGSLFFLETENPWDGEIRWDESNGLPLSSKEDADTHGIGLASIRRCARKYDGDIDIQIGERDGKKLFQLTVMMKGGAMQNGL